MKQSVAAVVILVVLWLVALIGIWFYRRKGTLGFSHWSEAHLVKLSRGRITPTLLLCFRIFFFTLQVVTISDLLVRTDLKWGAWSTYSLVNYAWLTAFNVFALLATLLPNTYYLEISTTVLFEINSV